MFGLRRERPPADLLASLEPDERVVSWADTADEQQVAATNRGLRWSDGRLIGWHQLNKVRWENGALVVIEAVPLDGDLVQDAAPLSARLRVPRDLPPVVRTRVERSIVRNELVRVDGGAVRFIGRRVPGVDGVHWYARLEPGTPDTDEVRAAVAGRLDRLRG